MSTEAAVQESIDEFWLSRTPNQAAILWDTWRDPHREHLLAAFQQCLPEVTSAYELGCGSGPNLRLLQYHYPKLRVGGSDLCKEYADFAADLLRVPIDTAEFPAVPAEAWDVVFSCYALAYAGYEVVQEMLHTLQARYLVLAEPGAWITPFREPGCYQVVLLPCYAHDYPGMLRASGWRMLFRWPIFPHHMGLNQVIVAERA